MERCPLDTCNTKKKRQSRVRIQFLAARATIISDETNEERTCLLGGGAGRSPIDRVTGGLRERKGLFNHLTLESVGFVSTEDEDFDAFPFLVAILPYSSRVRQVSGKMYYY